MNNKQWMNSKIRHIVGVSFTKKKNHLLQKKLILGAQKDWKLTKLVQFSKKSTPYVDPIWSQLGRKVKKIKWSINYGIQG